MYVMEMATPCKENMAGSFLGQSWGEAVPLLYLFFGREYYVLSGNSVLYLA